MNPILAITAVLLIALAFAGLVAVVLNAFRMSLEEPEAADKLPAPLDLNTSRRCHDRA